MGTLSGVGGGGYGWKRDAVGGQRDAGGAQGGRWGQTLGEEEAELPRGRS